MDSGKGSRRRTRSGIIKEKHTLKAGSNNEPAVEGLPDGWFKGYRPRKKGSASKVKSDPFYIDPISGYEFRSLKDVRCYLESGDINKCSRRPQKRKIEDLHIAGDQSHNTGTSSQHIQLGTADSFVKCGLPTAEGNKLPREALVNPNRGVNPENKLLSETKGTNPIRREDGRVEALEGKNGAPSVSTKHASGETEYVAGKEAIVELKPKEKKHRIKPSKPITTPFQALPRLAALKVRQAANEEPKDETISKITSSGNQGEKPKPEVDSSAVLMLNDGASTTGSTEKVENPDPSVSVQMDGAPIASSSAKAECQVAQGEKPVLPPQVAPVEPPGDKSALSLSSLFGNAWSDPCIEFAFKTLTGDIPVLDDTAAVANYFHLPQDSDKGPTPNCLSSTYEGARNHALVDHVSLPMPRPSAKLYSSSWFPPE